MKKLVTTACWTLVLSVFSSQTARANNLLSCAPGEEFQTALAVCAIKQGGCTVASRMAEDGAQKRFLLSEGCSALASEITGEGYDIADFLGAGIADVIDSQSSAALADNDPSNDWMGYFGKIVTGIYKVGSFAQCVDKAAKKCKSNWLYQNKAAAGVTNYQNVNDIIGNLARRHFAADNKCDINATLSFYDNVVYYESKDYSIDYIRKTKEAVCRRYTNEAANSINGDYISVSDFPKDSSIKVAKYSVSFNVYSKEQERRLTGMTDVIIAFRTDTQPPKIIGEIHKKQEKRCLIGINGEDLQYFHYNGQKFEYGARILSLIDDMPAKQMGLQPGDVLYRIDDANIQGMSFLSGHINNYPCRSHKIYYLRNNSIYEAVANPVLK